MAVLDILQYPDPRLKGIAEPVERFDDELRAFIQDLEDTMADGPGAVGIAATQVGRRQRIVIVDITSKPRFPNNGHMVLINPEITEWDGMAIGREGCLSVPDYTGNVVRAEKVTLRACDPDGNSHTYRCEAYEARAIQHEIDHLDGMLFIDRVVSRRNDLFRRKNYK
jgi:peptide deformylase